MDTDSNDSSNPRAVLFIESTEEGFRITEEAKEILHKYSDKNLGLISVVGKYRTGKSYFINKILLDAPKKHKFQVGPTVNPCTKGLWLWSETIKSQNPETPNLEFLVVDCEGFGGMDENANHDTRIFLISILLSSYFIYNSIGSIDENALNTLALVINLAKDVKVRMGDHSEEDTALLKASFPSLLWVVRDFSLKMVDANNQEITAKEYLEMALTEQKGNSDAIEKKNKIRRMTKHFFAEKDCVTMVRPVEMESDLQRLDKLEDKYLRPEFKREVENTRNKILRRAKPKILNGLTLNGSMLLNLAESYIKSLNCGRTPTIHTAWHYVCACQVETATKKALAKLEECSQDFKLGSAKIDPNWKREFKKQALAVFKKEVIGDDQEVKEAEAKLDEVIITKLEKLSKDLLEKCQESTIRYLKAKFDTLVETIKSQLYAENSIIQVQVQGSQVMALIGTLKDSIETIRTDFFADDTLASIEDSIKSENFNAYRAERENQILFYLTKELEEEKNRELQGKYGEMQGLQECLNQTRNGHLEEKQSSMDRARELEFENKTLKAENSGLNDKIKSFQERTKMEILNLENQNSMKSSSLQEKVDSFESEIKRLKDELDYKSKELIKKSQEVLNNQAFVDQEIELLKKKNDMFQNREKDFSMDKESLIRETKNLQDQILT